MKSAKALEMEHVSATVRSAEKGIAKLKQDDPGLEVDEAACKLMREQPEFKDYKVALDHVLQNDKDLAARYAASFGHLSPAQVKTFGVETPDPADESDDSVRAGKEIDELAQAWLREHPQETDYKVALDQILAAYPDLKMRWSKKYSAGFNPRTGKPWTPPQDDVGKFREGDDDEEMKRLRKKRADDGDDDSDEGGSDAAGRELDKLVEAWLKKNGRPDSDYEKGLGHILQTHPELAKRWMRRR